MWIAWASRPDQPSAITLLGPAVIKPENKNEAFTWTCRRAAAQLIAALSSPFAAPPCTAQS